MNARVGTRLSSSRWVALFAVIALVTAGCSDSNGKMTLLKAPAGPSPFSSADKAPTDVQGSAPFGPTGGSFKTNTVSVSVPAGAVANGTMITVTVMKGIGKQPAEIFGAPIGVDHTKPLGKPLTLTWETTGLTKWQLSTIVLAKWDDTTKTWQPQSVPVEVSGNTITAHVQSFSFWDWVANGGQQVGEWTGTRAGPPTCSKNSLPSWVQGVVNTEDDSKAAAILTCFEPDAQHQDDVSAKVVNNRTFTQQLVMTGGNQNWAWTWPGSQSYGVSDSVYTVAHAVFDSKTTFIVPPLASVAVGIARPASPGSYVVAATAKVNLETLFVDFTSFVFDQATVGGTDNPLLNAFLEALYECGGKQLLNHKSSDSMTDNARAVISAMAGCAKDLGDPNTEAGKTFQSLVQKAIKSSGASADEIAKSYRTLDEFSKAMKVLTIGEVAFYLSDQLANAAVGPLTFSVRGRGTPEQLGSWEPTCNSTKTDSNALYKNLALQDAFSDTSKELWQFPDWQPDAAAAVQPLSICNSSYRSQLASYLPGSWGDKKAAAIVADAITNLGAPAAPATTAAPPPPTTQPPAARSFTPGSSFDDYCVINWPTAPVYTSDSIQMVMGCAHVDEGQFFYTQVIYGDPNLKPTPSTGHMHVVGKVVDIATSAYGYRVLEVQASSITF